MRLHEVVRGVEVKEKEVDEITGTTLIDFGEIRGYNTLALSEVVVDRKQIFEIIVDVALPLKITEAIATAIESGSIISLKGQ